MFAYFAKDNLDFQLIADKWRLQEDLCGNADSSDLLDLPTQHTLDFATPTEHDYASSSVFGTEDGSSSIVPSSSRCHSYLSLLGIGDAWDSLGDAPGTVPGAWLLDTKPLSMEDMSGGRVFESRSQPSPFIKREPPAVCIPKKTSIPRVASAPCSLQSLDRSASSSSAPNLSDISSPSGRASSRRRACSMSRARSAANLAELMIASSSKQSENFAFSHPTSSSLHSASVPPPIIIKTELPSPSEPSPAVSSPVVGGGAGTRPQRYSTEQRMDAIHRYRCKRFRRKFEKTIRYDVRKVLAVERPRRNGRFISKSKLMEELLAS